MKRKIILITNILLTVFSIRVNSQSYHKGELIISIETKSVTPKKMNGEWFSSNNYVGEVFNNFKIASMVKLFNNSNQLNDSISKNTDKYYLIKCICDENELLEVINKNIHHNIFLLIKSRK